MKSDFIRLLHRDFILEFIPPFSVVLEWYFIYKPFICICILFVVKSASLSPTLLLYLISHIEVTEHLGHWEKNTEHLGQGDTYL